MNSPDLRQSTAWPLWLSVLVFMVIAIILALALALALLATWAPFTIAAILLLLCLPLLSVFLQRGIRPSFSLTTMFLVTGLVACGIVLRTAGSPWKQVHNFPSKGANVAMSADGKLVAASQVDSVEIRDTQTGRLVQTIKVSAAEVFAKGAGMWSCRFGFADGGKSLMTVGWKKYPCLFDVASGKEIRRWPAFLGQGNLAQSATRFMGDSTALSSPARQCNVFDVEQDQPILTVEDCHFWFRSISPTGSHVLVGKDETAQRGLPSRAELWDVDQKQLLGTIPLPPGQPLFFVKFSSDGKLLAVPTSTGLAVWDVAQCRQISQWTPANFASVWSMEWSPDGSRLVATYTEMIGPSGPVAAAAAMAGKSKPNAVEHSYLLDQQCQEIATIRGRSPTFSPSGDRMATVFGNANIFDGKSGEFLASLPSRPNRSFSGEPSFHFSPDGTWLCHSGFPPTVYQRTRSERWYSVYELPAFWGVILFLTALILQMVKSIPFPFNISRNSTAGSDLPPLGRFQDN